MQHGHSTHDHAVYLALWSMGTPETADADGNRITHAGMGKITARVGTINERNIPAIVRRLIDKQAIAVVSDEISIKRIPRVYRVFCFEEILERRRRRGLEWVVRSGRGVDFVDPQTGTPLQTASPADTASPVVTASPVIASSPSPAATSSPSPAATAPPLRNKEEEKRTLREINTTTTEIAEVHNGLRQWVSSPGTDDAPAILRACRGKAPDCTVADVLEACGELFRRSRPKNPIGLFVACAPAKVAGIVLERQFSSESEPPAPDLPDTELLQTARHTLDDPQSTEWERAAARSVLGDTGDTKEGREEQTS